MGGLGDGQAADDGSRHFRVNLPLWLLLLLARLFFLAGLKIRRNMKHSASSAKFGEERNNFGSLSALPKMGYDKRTDLFRNHD